MGLNPSKVDIKGELELLHEKCKTFVSKSHFHKKDSKVIKETYTYSLMLEILRQLVWENDSIDNYMNLIQSSIDYNMKGEVNGYLVTKEEREEKINRIREKYKKLEQYLSKELDRSKLQELKRKGDKLIKEKKNKENKHFQISKEAKSIWRLSQTGLNFSVY